MKSKLKPNVIYYWFQSRDIVVGAMRVKIKTVDDIFWQGFRIANNPSIIKEAEKRGRDISALNWYVINKRKAISQVKIKLSNVYNVINVHGKSILDIDGNIDTEKYKLKEMKLMKRGGKNEFRDPHIDKPYIPLKDFKSQEITLEKAKELNIL